MSSVGDGAIPPWDGRLSRSSRRKAATSNIRRSPLHFDPMPISRMPARSATPRASCSPTVATLRNRTNGTRLQRALLRPTRSSRLPKTGMSRPRRRGWHLPRSTKSAGCSISPIRHSAIARLQKFTHANCCWSVASSRPRVGMNPRSGCAAPAGDHDES
jgi:hypothetical protein